MRALRLLSMVFFLVALVGCDQASKHWAQERLQNAAAVEVVPRVLDLTYARNHQIAFSLLRGVPQDILRPALIGMGVLMLPAILWLWWSHTRGRRDQLQKHIGFALILAGGLGNFLDRIARGYVVDFIHVRYWPVFNVADICVAIGVVLLLLPALHARAAPS